MKRQNNKQISSPKENKSVAPRGPVKRDVFTWLWRNLLLAVVAWILIALGPRQMFGYSWVEQNYLKENIDFIRKYNYLTTEQRLETKLGVDYNYLLYLRDNTPSDAVIYYPSSGDFLKDQNPDDLAKFNGKLCDKLSAVRVLYPRKVVVESEWGKTSWSKKVTHIAIVNGQNLDKITYPIAPDIQHTVLPVKPNPFQEKK